MPTDWVLGDWYALVDRYNGRCVRCGVTPDHCYRGHIIPPYQGGTDKLANLQPLCKTCCSAKGPDTTNWPAYRDRHGFEVVS